MVDCYGRWTWDPSLPKVKWCDCDRIAQWIIDSGYKIKTTIENLVHMILLHFDCPDNYGEYGEEFTNFSPQSRPNKQIISQNKRRIHMNQFTINNAQFTISGNKIIIDCGNVDPKTLFHSKIEIGTLNPGDTFTQNGEKFIVLDKKPNGEVFVIKTDFLDDRHKFGENNDWRESPIRTSMNGGEIYQHMCELFGAKNIIDMHRDLTSLDGLDDYGTCIDKVSMMTTSEYTKYHKTLGVMSEYEYSWLTITPFSTPSNNSIGGVCCVNSSGILGWSGCGWGHAVRPVLTLSSSTLVDTEE